MVILLGVIACRTASSAPAIEKLPRVPAAQTASTTAGGYVAIDRDGVWSGELNGGALGTASKLGSDGLKKLRERTGGTWADMITDAQCTDQRRDQDGKALASKEMPARAQLCVLGPLDEPLAKPGATQLPLVVDREFPAVDAVKQLIAVPQLAALRIAVVGDDKKLRTLAKVGLALTGNSLPSGAQPPARDAVFEVGTKTMPVAGQNVWLWVKPGVTWGQLVVTIAQLADHAPGEINLVIDDPTPKALAHVDLPSFAGEVFDANDYVRIAANGDLELGAIPATANGPKGVELARLAAGTVVHDLDGYLRAEQAKRAGFNAPPPPPAPRRDTRHDEEGRARCGDRREPRADAGPDVPLRATICAGSQGHVDTLVLADKATPAIAVVKWLLPSFGVRLTALAVSSDGAHARAFDALVGGITSMAKTPLEHPAKTDPVFEVSAVPATGIAGKDLWIWVKPGVSYGELMAAIQRGLSGKPHGMSLTLDDPRR